MISAISRQAAKRLRPEGAFHLPPGAQPLGAICELVVEDSPLQPEAVITDTRRVTEHDEPLSWHFYLLPTGTPGQWSATLQVPPEPTILTYRFEFPGSDEAQPPLLEIRQVEGEIKPVYGEYEQHPFKIAVYDPARMPAEWTQGMVIYQIFPDRFANGDPSTDGLMKGVYGHEPQFRRWGERPEYPPLGRDFFGGDLRGVIQHLDYLADLGIDCIYFCPIFDAPTNHRYDAIDYFKIDPMLGTEADFDELIERSPRARDQDRARRGVQSLLVGQHLLRHHRQVRQWRLSLGRIAVLPLVRLRAAPRQVSRLGGLGLHAGVRRMPGDGRLFQRRGRRHRPLAGEGDRRLALRRRLRQQRGLLATLPPAHRRDQAGRLLRLRTVARFDLLPARRQLQRDHELPLRVDAARLPRHRRPIADRIRRPAVGLAARYAAPGGQGADESGRTRTIPGAS